MLTVFIAKKAMCTLSAQVRKWGRSLCADMYRSRTCTLRVHITLLNKNQIFYKRFQFFMVKSFS